MGLTRVQLIARVRNRLAAVTDDALLTTSELYTNINEGILAFADERDWPWLEATGTISATAGTSSYSLPADFVREHVIDINGATLDFVQYADLLTVRDASPGQPTRYAIVGDTIRLNPVPEKAYTVNLYYQRQEKELANDTDVTYAPSRRGALLATYAALYAAVRVRDAALIQSLIKLRDDELKRAIDDVQRGTQGPRIQTRTDNHVSGSWR